MLNAVLGERLAIVTAKPQTTRSRILGILQRPGAQLLFLDTPGRHRSPKKLNEKLNAVVAQVARDCDVALLLVDRAAGWSEVHDELAEALIESSRPTLLSACASPPVGYARARSRSQRPTSDGSGMFRSSPLARM